MTIARAPLGNLMVMKHEATVGIGFREAFVSCLLLITVGHSPHNLYSFRYNPENLATLERYVDMQARENVYDLEANLAVLKLWVLTYQLLGMKYLGKFGSEQQTLDIHTHVKLLCLHSQHLHAVNHVCMIWVISSCSKSCLYDMSNISMR